MITQTPTVYDVDYGRHISLLIMLSEFGINTDVYNVLSSNMKL